MIVCHLPEWEERENGTLMPDVGWESNWPLCVVCGIPHRKDEMRNIPMKNGKPSDCCFVCRKCDDTEEVQ